MFPTENQRTMVPYCGQNNKYSQRKYWPNKNCFIPSTVIAIIPFKQFKTTTCKKEDILTFKLCSEPMNEASATYNLMSPFFKSGTPEELFCFLENIEKVIIGQHIHAADQQYSLMQRLLQGDALVSFNQSTITHGVEDNLNFVTCTNKLIAHVLPQQAYLEQKHYMRHFLKKPRDCSVQEFVTRLFEMNQYLD